MRSPRPPPSTPLGPAPHRPHLPKRRQQGYSRHVAQRFYRSWRAGVGLGIARARASAEPCVFSDNGRRLAVVSDREWRRRRSQWSAMKAWRHLIVHVGETTPSRAIVRGVGEGYRLGAHAVKRESSRAAVLHPLLRNTQVLITRMAQIAACNRHHAIDQQLCRSLLLTRDRLRSDEPATTQVLIANMLGVRRESVTEAASSLQRAGLIQCVRQIKIFDRKGLEQRSCECYAVVGNEYDRLPPGGRLSSRPIARVEQKQARFQCIPTITPGTIPEQPIKVGLQRLLYHHTEFEDRRGCRFAASFSVDSPGHCDSAWQQFPSDQFSTASAASANAVDAAKISIDQHLAFLNS